MTRTTRLAILAALAIGAVGCGQPAASANPTAAQTVAVTTAPSPTPVPATATATASAQAIDSPIVGNWVRDNRCEDQLSELLAAGFADMVAWWVVGNWWGEGAVKPEGEECTSTIPEEHSHFFTADGRFGSRDKDKFQVDGGDFVLVDEKTLAFPSHSAEFAYDGDILVDFMVDGDTATFTVLVPATCEGPCRMAHGWAISAFFGPEPWNRSR